MPSKRKKLLISCRQHKPLTMTTTSSRASKRLGSTTGSSQQHQQQQQQQQQQQSNQNGVIDMALATLQPLRDLSRNWDVDVASWYVSY